ncbi:hypothetical protein CAEBREN_29233 [Caenorhabditis brenneri]|uniref:CUB-like domain-containing protein n=1 Tax=Caenorhabditis brenneri TaxID=135651 RepID=G0PCK2_CAEBE|nr:hypothetical protein CAEBREN_29233 [Caenorhabditis brenneri]
MSAVRWIVAFGLFVGLSSALDCVQVPDSNILPGHFATIPAGANETIEIQPNFNCIYYIKVPPMVYAHVRLENGLKGGNDMITVYDEQGRRTLISSRSSPVQDFYVFPNTTTTFQVVTKSVNMHSAFRLVIFYQKMLNPSVTVLGNTLKYFVLNNLQVNTYKTPQTMTSSEGIVLTIARSGWEYDKFDNFFVVEGDFQNPKYVYRMNQFVDYSYFSGTNLTVVGLDNSVSESSVIFTPFSQYEQFDEYTGITTYFEANQFKIDSTSGRKQKKAVTVISMSDYVMFLDVQKSSDPNCSLKAVEAPPTNSSQVLLDFSTFNTYPRNITRKSFSIVAENCAATFRMVSPSNDN